MKNSCFKALGLVFFLLVPSLAKAGNPWDKNHWLEWQWEVRVGAAFSGRPVTAFENFSQDVRTLPWHPDDNYNNSRYTTIPESTLNPKKIPVSGSYFLGTGMMLKKRVSFRAGLILDTGNDSSAHPGNDGPIRSVNIYSNVFERGYGTSLVYIAALYKGPEVKLVFAPEIEIKIGKIGLLAGTTRRTYDFVLQRGYDRWNSLETLDETPLASTQVTHHYAGIRLIYLDDVPTLFTGIIFTAGPVYGKTTMAPDFQGVRAVSDRGVRFNLSFMIGTGIKTW